MHAPKRGTMGSIMKRASLFCLFLLIAAEAAALPSFREVREAYRESDAFLLDRRGEVIHVVRVEMEGRRLEWTALKDISPSLVQAVIHSEDRGFYGHRGVDWTALGAAAVRNLFAKNPRGASTITMQLASMLEGKPVREKGRRTLARKWEQIEAARELERSWTKGSLLEAYLNLVTFRGELQGIAAAARGLFGKEPSGLDGAESLLLAALIRSPNAAPKEVAKRACVLAASLQARTTCGEIRKITAEKLSGSYSVRPRTALAPHAAHLLLHEGGQRVSSTLDAGIQRFAAEVLDRQVRALRCRNVRDGAVLVADNRTGEVLAYVANTGASSSAPYVDGIRAKRQAGSTLKPFLYGLAIEKGMLTAASLLDDSPLSVPTPAGLYIPRNYDADFKGPVSVRTALSSSLNVPAVRTLMLVGPETFAKGLRQFGFGIAEEGDYYGFSLALGSAEVSLYELVNAYRTLANGGIAGELTLLPRKGKGKTRRAVEEGAAFIISDILSDRESRSATFGLENPLSTRFWSAVKTGTSKDMKDNWCIGYSQRYTVGVWVGNFSGEPMWNVSGVSGAAPSWLEIMEYLHRKAPGGAPRPPRGIVAGKTGERQELFLSGTEPPVFAGEELPDAVQGENARIMYPAQGTLVALDPDIPDELQRVFFEARPARTRYEWVLDGERMPSAGSAVPWRPERGKHRLSLYDGRGRLLDTVEFEVRGTENGGKETEKEEKMIKEEQK